MSDPKIAKAFEKFVKLEQEPLVLVEKRVEEDHKMLIQMQSSAGR